MKKSGLPAWGRAVVIGIIVLFSPTMAQGGPLQEQFDELCIHTQNADDLSLEKLRELVVACDQLKKDIEQSSEEKKKLLLFRLKKCRDFLAYIIELKEGEGSDGSQ